MANDFSAGDGIKFPRWEKAELILSLMYWGNFPSEEVVIKKDGYVHCYAFADSTGVSVSLKRNGTSFLIAGLKSNVNHGGFTDYTVTLTPVKKGDIISVSGAGGFTLSGSHAGMCGNGAQIRFIPFE